MLYVPLQENNVILVKQMSSWWFTVEKAKQRQIFLQLYHSTNA